MTLLECVLIGAVIGAWHVRGVTLSPKRPKPANTETDQQIREGMRLIGMIEPQHLVPEWRKPGSQDR